MNRNDYMTGWKRPDFSECPSCGQYSDRTIHDEEGWRCYAYQVKIMSEWSRGSGLMVGIGWNP